MSHLKNDIRDINCAFLRILKINADPNCQHRDTMGVDDSLLTLISKADESNIVKLAGLSLMMFIPRNLDYVISNIKTSPEILIKYERTEEMNQTIQFYISAIRSLAKESIHECQIRFGLDYKHLELISNLSVSEVITLSKSLKMSLRTKNTKLLFEQLSNSKNATISRLKISSIFISEDE